MSAEEEKEAQINYSQEDKDKIGKNYIQEHIFDLLTKEPSRKLEELCFSIVNYKVEVEKFINENKPIQYSSFKQNLYKELESLLCQASYMESKDDRNEKIEKIHKWYKDKMKYYLSLAKIEEKTYYDKNEHPKVLKEEKKVDDTDEEISAINHRTNFAKGFNLKLYRVKKIRVKNKKKIVTKQKINASKLDYYKNEEGKNPIAKKKEKEQKLIEKQKSPNMSTLSTGLNSKSSKRELKSSYSYAEPKFTFSQGVIEAQIIKEKQKALARKRTEEEIKEAINDFGAKRALFKGNREKNYAIKEMIELYSTKNKQEKESKEEETFNSINSTIINRKSSVLNTTGIPDSLKQKKLNRSRSQAITAKDKEMCFQKVIVSNVKNINKDTLQVKKSIKEVNVTINMKLKNYISRQKIFTERNWQTEEHPSDTLMAHISIDSLFKVKVGFNKLCHVKEKRVIDTNGKSKRLSAYDNRNYKLFSRRVKESEDDAYSNNSSQNNSTTLGSSEYVKKHFRNSSMDFLNLRQTMQCFQMKEVMSLKKTIKKDRLNRSCLIDAFVNPSTNTFYPKYYLPFTGSGLLSKPIEIDIKAKKTKI